MAITIIEWTALILGMILLPALGDWMEDNWRSHRPGWHEERLVHWLKNGKLKAPPPEVDWEYYGKLVANGQHPHIAEQAAAKRLKAQRAGVLSVVGPKGRHWPVEDVFSAGGTERVRK
jgi:hypothetical protein